MSAKVLDSTRRELAYAVTSLPPAEADPQKLLALWRGHWVLTGALYLRFLRPVSE